MIIEFWTLYIVEYNESMIITKQIREKAKAKSERNYFAFTL